MLSWILLSVWYSNAWSWLGTYVFNVSFSDLLTGFLPFLLWTCDEFTWRFRRQKGRFVFFLPRDTCLNGHCVWKKTIQLTVLWLSAQNPYQKIERHIFYSVRGLSGIVLSTFNVCSFVHRMMFHQCASSKHVFELWILFRDVIFQLFFTRKVSWVPITKPTWNILYPKCGLVVARWLDDKVCNLRSCHHYHYRKIITSPHWPSKSQGAPDWLQMQQDGSLSVSNTGAKTPGIPGLTALLELVPLVFNEFMAVF